MITYNHLGDTASLSNGHTVTTFDVCHPATGVVVHQAQRSTGADVDCAIETAYRSRISWARTSLEKRSGIILNAIKLLQDPSSTWADRLRDANIAETSVTFWWSQEQVHVVSLFINSLVLQAPKALELESVIEGEAEVTLQREPYGVCLAIAPWNAVHLLTARAIITPLLAGNTVVLKTSEKTPYTQTLWARLLYEAGLPRGCLQVINIAPEDAREQVKKLVADKRVRHVNFTGSTRVGSIIAGLAGQNLKPSLMELGGKAPVLLLPGANIETAASHIIFGTFMNAGQICMGTELVFVVKSRYQELVSELNKAWSTVKIKQHRALFSSDSGLRVRTLIQDALSKRASHLLEYDLQDDDRPTFARLSMVGPVTSQMAIFTEETFGPVSAVVVVDDSNKSEEEIVDEMISLANDTEYGLTAAVWSDDLELARTVASQLETGAVHINAPATGDLPNVPHGGWKSSGWGRFNGFQGLLSFTQIRIVELHSGPAHPLPLNVFEL